MEIGRVMISCLLAIAALACSAQASAQAYVGAGFGRSEADENITVNLIDSGTVDATDTGFKIFGGYRFHPNFGVESGYVDLGEVRYFGTFTNLSGTVQTVTDGTVEASGASLGPVVFVPLTPAFELFGKAGLFVWEAEANDITGGVPFSGSEDGTDVFLGLGLSYAFTRNLLWRAEWEQFRLDEADASLLSFSLVYRF